MKTEEFNRDYEIDRRSRNGVKATAKRTTADSTVADIPLTADGADFDPAHTYHFFEPQTRDIRQSIGLRRDGPHLSTFGLKVIPVNRLRAHCDVALADGQSFFRAEIERFKERIAACESEKDNQL